MIKEIAVHLTGSQEDEVRLAHAGAIAARFDGHITGFYVYALPELLATGDGIGIAAGAGYVETMIAESRDQSQQVAEALRQRFSTLTVPNELRRLEVYPSQAGNALAAEARTADLFVGTRPYGDPKREAHIAEAVLFDSGHGCLFVPPGVLPTEPGSVFIAWKNTREAARAVAAAMPFLRRAARVTIGIVDEPGAGVPFAGAPGADLARYLSRHGIAAEIRTTDGSVSTGEALLNEAGQTGAQLIVMGGYGHSRFREWILGGATRDLLTNAPVPVLTAH